MGNNSVDYWSKRALDFVREMEEANLDTPSIINTVVERSHFVAAFSAPLSSPNPCPFRIPCS